MKSKFSLLVFLLFATVVQAQQYNDLINLSHYSKDNSRIVAKEDHPEVVFLGNSITQGWVEKHPDFFIANDFAGRGISGQTSPQLLSRFRQDVVRLHPRAVVINVGTNDIAENTGAYNMDFTLDNIKSMTEIAQANGIKVILTSVLPAAGFSWRPKITDAVVKIDKLNGEIVKYAKSKGLAYVDYNSAMRTENGALKGEYSPEGVHPNVAGYAVMEALVLPVINKTLKHKGSACAK